MIVIEGPVGVGKTQLLELLVANGYIPNMNTFVNNVGLLDNFYYDREKYGFLIQIHFLTKRLSEWRSIDKEKGVVDRSIYGDYVFTKVLYENKELTEEEYEVLTELMNAVREYVEAPTLIIYLTSDTDKTIKNINSKGRESELVADIEYWNLLHNEYEAFFEDFNECEVLKLDISDYDLRYSREDKQYVLDLIEQKLREVKHVKEE